MRCARGRYSFSSVYGNGVSKPVTRTGGASRDVNARSLMSATSSAPNPQVFGASWTTTTRPVFFTLSTTVSIRYGRKKSKIVIECAGREEFERVFQRLKNA